MKYGGSSHIRFISCNLNSIQNKLSFVHHMLLEEDVDVFAVCETWLIDSVGDSFVALPGYNLFRRDVLGSVRKHGVCVYIRSSIDVLCCSDDVADSVPNTLVVYLSGFCLYLVVVYRPPSYGIHENSLLLQFLNDFCPGKEVVLMGDFNLPSLKWIDCVGDGISSIDRQFYDAFLSLGLTQWVRKPTYVMSDNILDLVLTSSDDRVLSLELLAPLPNCHHMPVFFEYAFAEGSWDCAGSAPGFLWFNGDYAGVVSYLLCVDWDVELGELTVNNMYERFISVLNSTIEAYVPVKTCMRGRPPWKHHPPKDVLRSHAKAWSDYKSIRSTHGRNSMEAIASLERFQRVNSLYRNYDLTCRCSYEKMLVDRYKDSPKLFHSYIRNQKHLRLSVGPVSVGGEVVSDPGKMCSCFADAFSSVFSDEHLSPVVNQICFDRLLDLQFSVNDVLHLLQDLKSSSSGGPDGLHPHFLKMSAEAVAYPLFLLFSRSLKSGVLPEIWKTAFISPIFKSGIRGDPLNYRPISLTCVCSKMFERLISHAITEYLEVNKILTSEQFGFRTGRSVEDQLLLTYGDITGWVNAGCAVDMILFDFSKAFDTINHCMLLEKLASLGIGGSILRWISGFLMNRTMEVVIDGVHSAGRPVLSGVPQGSVLGPLLFIVYINSIASNLRCSYKIFADDLKLYLRNGNRFGGDDEYSASFQSDIDTIYCRSMSMGLSMNFGKCHHLRFGGSTHSNGFVHYYLGGQVIEGSQLERDLGVYVDIGLKFHSHIDKVVLKASGLAMNFLRSTVCRDQAFMINLFTTHIRPVLESCCALWCTGYVQDMRRLESVQRRWTRSVEGLSDMSYGDRLRVLDLYSVKGRMLRYDIIKCWKIMHGVCSIDPGDLFIMNEGTRTRGHSFKISIERAVLECRRRFFSVRVAHEWNNLPAVVAECTDLSLFKHMLAQHLGERLFDYYD